MAAIGVIAHPYSAACHEPRGGKTDLGEESKALCGNPTWAAPPRSTCGDTARSGRPSRRQSRAPALLPSLPRAQRLMAAQLGAPRG